MIYDMITIVWYLDSTTEWIQCTLQRKRESRPSVWRSGHSLYNFSQWSHHRNDRQHVPQICKWITVSYISTRFIELCFICMFTDSSIIIITTTVVLKYLSLIFFWGFWSHWIAEGWRECSPGVDYVSCDICISEESCPHWIQGSTWLSSSCTERRVSC